MSDLQVFNNNDGLELVIDTKTGEAFASISAVGRMCDVNKSTISRYTTSAQMELKRAEILTSTGFKTSALLNEDQILECVAKYNNELLLKFAKLGTRMFLHTLAGYNVTSTAVEPQQPQLPPAHIQATNLINALQFIGFDVNNPRFNTALKDLVGDILGLNQNQLPAQTEKWLGVAERAEQLGYEPGLVTRYRSTLGKFVKSKGLVCKLEKRLCNGTEREINLYLQTSELDNIIHTYFQPKIVK